MICGRILEVGPCQNGLSKYLSSFNYQSLDKDKEFTTYKMDVQNITIDGVFDLIYVSHVLEYVENDILAVSELAKILNKNGKIVIQEAIFGIPETKWGYVINIPTHLKHIYIEPIRSYGVDIKNRLKASGLLVSVIDVHQVFDLEKYAISNPEDGFLYVCTKNKRRQRN